MGEIQMTNGLGDMQWFFGIKRLGRALANGAKTAMSRTDIAPEHERRGTIRPALKDVWAARFLANRVQVQAFDQLEQVILIRWIAQTNLEPLRFWLPRFLI